MSDVLPEGWAVTKLNEVVSFALGGDWGKDPDESADDLIDVKVIRGTEFKTWGEDKGASAAERRIKISSLEKRRLQKGDLVLEVSGGGPNQPVGRTILIDDEALKRAGAPLVCSNFFRLLRLRPEVDSNFISRFLSYAYGRGAFNEFQTETTNLRNLNVSDFLGKTDVALAPQPEQRRIVAKLEMLLGKAEACQRRLAKIPRLLKRFRQSVLAAACSGRLTADWRERNGGDSYESTTVEAIAEYVGGFAYKSPTFLKTGKHQVMRIGNVRPFALKLAASPIFIPEEIAEQTQRFKLLPGDIVISMTGTKYKQDYGFASLVSEADGSLFLNQRVARVRCGKSALPKFLLFWFQSDLFREFFFSGETGNVNQGNVGASGIRNAAIELPPLVEQREIVRRVEQLFTLADQLEARFAKAQAHVDKLTQSLLAKAFRGELVPQDPNDEPASALLVRIRPEVSGAEKPTRRKNKTVA